LRSGELQKLQAEAEAALTAARKAAQAMITEAKEATQKEQNAKLAEAKAVRIPPLHCNVKKWQSHLPDISPAKHVERCVRWFVGLTLDLMIQRASTIRVWGGVNPSCGLETPDYD